MSDQEHYRKEHLLIFGHYPVPDLLTGRQCGHPMHDFVAGMMDMPGVDIEIPFDPHEIITEDDPEARQVQEWYDKEVEQWRDVVKDVEEREEREQTGKKQF